MKELINNIKVDLIERELALNPELWDQNTLRTAHENSPHAGCSDIWLRFRPPEDLTAMTPVEFANSPYEPMWWPAAEKLKATRKIIDSIAKIMDAEEVGACLLTRIPPGGQVKPHRDLNYNSQHFLNKYLIVVKSAPGQVFRHHGVDYETRTGSCWLFDNRIEHSVINQSDTDRISLIISIKQVGQQGAA